MRGSFIFLLLTLAQKNDKINLSVIKKGGAYGDH